MQRTWRLSCPEALNPSSNWLTPHGTLPFCLFTTHAICRSPNLPPQPLALCARFPLMDALSKAHQARSHSPTACIPLYQRSQQGLLCWPPSGSSARRFGGRPHVRCALATYHLHPTRSSEDEGKDDNLVTPDLKYAQPLIISDRQANTAMRTPGLVGVEAIFFDSV